MNIHFWEEIISALWPFAKNVFIMLENNAGNNAGLKCVDLSWHQSSSPHLLSPEVVLTSPHSNSELAPTLQHSEHSGLLETVNQGGIRGLQTVIMTDYTFGAPTILLCVLAYQKHKDTVKTCFRWTRT